MAASIDYYPAFYQEWLFDTLALKPGDEIAPATLEPLFTLNKAWLDGGALPADYFADPAVLRAYCLFYMTINMPKLWFLFDRTGSWPSGRIVDLGCGPGTLIWAWLFYAAARAPERLERTELIGIERTPQAAELGQRLAERLQQFDPFRSISVRFQVDEWQQRPISADCVLGGNVLLECPPEDLGRLADIQAETWILIEPGNRPGFQRILSAREQLVGPDRSILFPCPSYHDCPMAEQNWCHFAVNRSLVPFVQRMANAAGRRNHRHCFSALAIGPAQTAPASAWRVLSDVRKAHRSGIRYLCDGKQMHEVVLNRRKRSASNSPFLEAATGELLTVKPNAHAQSTRLQASSVVMRGST